MAIIDLKVISGHPLLIPAALEAVKTVGVSSDDPSMARPSSIDSN